MNVDLHCHSYLSDGKQTPEFLLQRATNNRISHLAITDHDCTDALDLAAEICSEVVVVSGVEISCLWDETEVHVLGLLVDRHNRQLSTLLKAQQLSRWQRMQAMDKKLVALGTQGLIGYIEQLGCVACSRSHVADFLVDSKLCKSRQKAFKSHLGRRGKIYVRANWTDLADAISAITAAGGIAVLAHPSRYPLNNSKLTRLVEAFKAQGGEGLEGTYANIDQATQKQLKALALANDLYLSAGSDFHDSAAQWTDIGKFPPLDREAQLRAIWHHPRWQALYPCA
jgi:predicted metal-dependent phosphoesterase TrpH